MVPVRLPLVSMLIYSDSSRGCCAAGLAHTSMPEQPPEAHDSQLERDPSPDCH